MSVGRVSTFLDIYIERDLKNGILTEEEAQELIDHMTMKFRMVKFARIESYNQLFSGDPVWATLEVAGIGMDGRSPGYKDRLSVSCIHLENMGPSPEPNLTVLYSSHLPESIQEICSSYFYCIQVPSSMRTTMLCVRYGAMITPSAAVYLQQRQEKRSSSSVPEQTLQNACFTRSTVVWMRRHRDPGRTGLRTDHIRISGL